MYYYSQASRAALVGKTKAFSLTNYSCQVVSYLKARIHYTDCLGFSFFCSLWLLPYNPLHPFPLAPACFGERSAHCDLWSLTEVDLEMEVFRTPFNSCHPFSSGLHFKGQTLFFKLFSPYPKLTTELGDGKPICNTPCPSHVISGHWFDTALRNGHPMVLMTF